jgi:hypothetical protein
MTLDSVGELHHEFNPMVEPHRQDPHLFYDWARRERPVAIWRSAMESIDAPVPRWLARKCS